MSEAPVATRSFRVLSALAGIVGVVMIIVSFSINAGPPPNASAAELTAFGTQHFAAILWGAWLQAVGPLLIVLFAFALVLMAGFATRLSGWMTLVGGIILMMVSLFEVTIYISALDPVPSTMTLTSIDLGHAIQHLYFIVAGPALFLPLGLVVLGSRVLPRGFGYLALVLGAAFAICGVVFLYDLVLPDAVTALAAVQALWWLAAAITLIVRPSPGGTTPKQPEFPPTGELTDSTKVL